MNYDACWVDRGTHTRAGFDDMDDLDAEFWEDFFDSGRHDIEGERVTFQRHAEYRTHHNTRYH